MTADREPSTIRFLPYAVADGAANMALDETLLHSAQQGQATLRFYGWSEPTLSLGYFQPESVRHQDAHLAALPWVRRPSGGATLVHHHEVTYALALPAGPPWQTGECAACWLRHMHEIVARGLADLGVPSRLHTPLPDQTNPGFLCFRHFTPGDVLIGLGKVAGSAQRRQRGALLQHGGILLAASPLTPILPGILELTACRVSPEEVVKRVSERFAWKTGWALVGGELTGEERRLAAELASAKYSSDAWNRKR
jgi:lipoate-protein ligase A